MGVLLSGADIDRAIKRISHEILEHNQGINNLVLMGIPTRGRTLLIVLLLSSVRSRAQLQ